MKKWLLVAGLTMVAVMTGQDRAMVHGHRGARAVLPENLIPGFEYAIEAGADFI